MAPSPAEPTAAPAAIKYEPDQKKALKLVRQLMAIAGPSGHEAAVAQFVKDALVDAGLEASAIQHDTAHKKTRLQGEVGNLVATLPGTIRAPRRMLSAHLDTVPICVGAQPIERYDYLVSGNPHTGLGADNRAGVAVVLTAALEILRNGLPHPPLTFFWPVQEEVGIDGVRNAQLSRLKRPKLAFNWDGGTPEKLTVGATGAYRMTIDITGHPSHAGIAPEHGVSAITIAALAIADLHRHGWHGKIQKGRSTGTSNVGIIQGGAATNVVTEHVQVRAEARSHDPKFRDRILAEIEAAFQRAVDSVADDTDRKGTVAIDAHIDYESFQLADDEACVLAAEAAVRAAGEEPLRSVANGGLDANWLTSRGIPTVTLGCGQQNAHTILERMYIPWFHQACRIALCLATASESADC
ncbi:MAG: M20/M25/M40 family metallo-hydrolase [Planctomycetales bacterium]|nr:M20/M25/M40 family metallo-hydrolase [Planctomycetales bacterium]